nr:hypothetical protein [Tanacetum cinerariifolium]
MTSPEMRETKAYKTYLGYATGVTPSKKARKFKKPASPKLSTVPTSPEEPTKKSSDAPTAGVVIRETPAKSLSKKKEKMTVEKRKGIDLLSEAALTEEAQYEEVYKKSLRDFYKTRPSGSGTVTKIAPSAVKIKPSVTNEGTGAKLGVLDVTEEESTESEAESWGRDKNENNNDHDSRSEGSDQERDSGDDNTQSDSEKGSDSKHETNENEMGYESNQEENEEDVEDDEEEKDDELNKPVTTDEGFIQKEGTDAKMTNIRKGNENPEITLNQVIEDAHVTLSTVPQKTEVPVTSSSHSSNLATKFLNFSDIPHTYAEIIFPIDVHVHHQDNPKGGDYPFDLTKPLPLVMNENRQMVPVDYFFNNDIKYLQGGILTMTYTTSITKTKAAQDDLPGIEDMVKIFRVLLNSPMINMHFEKKINVTKLETTRHGLRKKDPYTPYQDPQGFIYVNTQGRNRLMYSDELYKFSDGTLTRLQTLLDDITKNIQMEYLLQRRWSSLEKKRAKIMIKAIDKQMKEMRMMRSLEKFVGGRHYGTDLRLL